jgi:hypothetical protein
VIIRLPLVLSLVFATSVPALAQNQGSGAKGGLNFTSVQLEVAGADATSDRRTGFVGGLFFQLPVARQLSAQFETLYAQKGSEGGDAGSLKLDYFELPLLLRWDSTSTGNPRGNLFAGPSFNFNTRARAEAGGVEEDIADDVEALDVGLIVGAGAEFGRFLIDGRYQHGLREVKKDAGAEDSRLRHRAFSLMVGVRF